MSKDECCTHFCRNCRKGFSHMVRHGSPIDLFFQWCEQCSLEAQSSVKDLQNVEREATSGQQRRYSDVETASHGNAGEMQARRYQLQFDAPGIACSDWQACLSSQVAREEMELEL